MDVLSSILHSTFGELEDVSVENLHEQVVHTVSNDSVHQQSDMPHNQIRIQSGSDHNDISGLTQQYSLIDSVQVRILL